MEEINKRYNTLCNTPSDIYEHLPTLYRYAKESESFLECGIRGCVSSWAISKGICENNRKNKKLYFNDINEVDINTLEKCLSMVNVPYELLWCNDLDVNILS